MASTSNGGHAGHSLDDGALCTGNRPGDDAHRVKQLVDPHPSIMQPISNRAVLMFARRRVNPADRLLIGVAVGTGFAVLEAVGYGFVTLLASAGDLGYMGGRLLVWAALGPAQHAVWTGVVAAGPVVGTGRFLAVGVLRSLWGALMPGSVSCLSGCSVPLRCLVYSTAPW